MEQKFCEFCGNPATHQLEEIVVCKMHHNKYQEISSYPIFWEIWNNELSIEGLFDFLSDIIHTGEWYSPEDEQIIEHEALCEHLFDNKLADKLIKNTKNFRLTFYKINWEVNYD